MSTENPATWETLALAVNPDEYEAIRTIMAAADGDETFSALTLTIAAKRLQALGKNISDKQVRYEANQQWRDLSAGEKTAKYAGVTVSSYTKRAKYAYPADIVAREAELKKDKKAAEAPGGGAIKQLDEVDLHTDTTFSIKL